MENIQMQKSEALKIFNLNENFSELEIKKKYRKLILECHPQKNNSEESRKKYQKIQEAYELLISEFSINPKVNFGVSKQEIEEFEKEEIKNLTDLSPEDLEKIAKIDREEFRDFSVEEFNIYLKKKSEFRELKKLFSDNIEKIERQIGSINTEEVLFYSTPEQREIYQN